MERPVDVDGEIIYDVGEDMAKKMGELSRTEAIRNQVQQAHLDRNVVCNAIDDKIKKSIAALDDTPQDHGGSDAQSSPANRVRRSSAKHQPGGRLIRSH